MVQRGLEAALKAQGRADAAALKEEKAAGRGDRAGLGRQAVEAEQAAQQLLTAGEMLKANPKSHAAQCSYSEVSVSGFDFMHASQFSPCICYCCPVGAELCAVSCCFMLSCCPIFCVDGLSSHAIPS